MDVNLILFNKNGTTRDFPLTSNVSVIGRRQQSDLCIPLMLISRRHCEIDIDKDQVVIRDLGSRNGTILNGRKIEESQLNPGDILKVGPIMFGVQINGQPETFENPFQRQAPISPAAAEAKAAHQFHQQDDELHQLITDDSHNTDLFSPADQEIDFSNENL